MFKRLTVVLLLAALNRPVSADDLLRVYEDALQFAPSLQASGHKVEMGAAQKGQALGVLLPQVTGTANWSENKLTQITSEVYRGTRYFVSITQSIIDFGKYWDLQRTKDQMKQYDAERIEAQQNLLVDIVKRYFAILDAQDELQYLDTEKLATEGYKLQMDKLFAKQLVKVTDVYEVDARLDQILADRIEAESNLFTAKQALKELTSTDSDYLAPLRETIEYHELEGKLEEWIEVAVNENPSLSAQRLAVQTASDEVAVKKSKLLPVVDLQLYYYDTNTGYQSVLIGHTQTQVAAINVNVPIFSGGSGIQSVNESQSKLAISKQENESKIRAMIKETSQAFTLANANAKRILAAQKAVESAGKSLEAMQSGFQHGIKNMRDVLEAQQVQYKARRDLAKSRYNYITNRVRFLKAIGTINEDNLAEVNNWLVK
ncbi:MAG: TolC family outer membrane protein [Methylomonas sp.]|jgi:outer membrane protein